MHNHLRDGNGMPAAPLTIRCEYETMPRQCQDAGVEPSPPAAWPRVSPAARLFTTRSISTGMQFRTRARAGRLSARASRSRHLLQSTWAECSAAAPLPSSRRRAPLASALCCAPAFAGERSGMCLSGVGQPAACRPQIEHLRRPLRSTCVREHVRVECVCVLRERNGRQLAARELGPPA